jgi:very-short-patch-repair endonuclease
MTTPTSHALAHALAARQHHNITRAQLLDLGFSRAAVHHWLDTYRLHRVFRGVYAIGRPHDAREGIWMAAVLRGGEGAVLSHGSAAEHWGIRPRAGGWIEVWVPARRQIREHGLRAHRAVTLRAEHVTTRSGIPTTSPARTLIDISPRLSVKQRERAINEADRLGLVNPERLLLVARVCAPHVRGATVLCRTLESHTFARTRSDLEREFLRLVRAAGLPKPLTRQMVNGFEVDFYWPELRLVVETDGLRYHRTPAQQARDRIRDQTHLAAGLIPLRFTAAQITHERVYVIATLRAVAERAVQAT